MRTHPRLYPLTLDLDLMTPISWRCNNRMNANVMRQDSDKMIFRIFRYNSLLGSIIGLSMTFDYLTNEKIAVASVTVWRSIFALASCSLCSCMFYILRSRKFSKKKCVPIHSKCSETLRNAQIILLWRIACMMTINCKLAVNPIALFNNWINTVYRLSWFDIFQIDIKMMKIRRINKFSIVHKKMNKIKARFEKINSYRLKMNSS